MSHTIKGTDFDYRIDTEYGINHDGFIAEGTESIVFKGIKYGNDLRYSCALKFKPKSRLSDFMKREYKILESMQTCRSVVRVLDVIEDLGDFSMPYGDGEISGQNCFCVVEEYIDGDSLQDYCIKQWFEYNNDTHRWVRNSTPYTYREIVKYQNQIVQFMINLCEIMKFVSNINAGNGKTDPNKPVILHCDIKPENIMVTKHGKELVLIDFGRSQELTDSRTYQHYSDKENKTFDADYGEKQWQDIGKDNFYAYGTVGYAAPECYADQSKRVTKSYGTLFPFIAQKKALQHGLISVESDIFGFGATFWECLSIYEIGTDILNKAKNPSSTSFFNKAITAKYEDDIHKGIVEEYCDRDFRNIDSAYHESLEMILKKCTRTREFGFQDPDNTPNQFYHNFQSLQNDIERARDTIPSLDRKSDPLVRQMIGVSGFCSSLTICFLVLFLMITFFSNSIAWDKWNNLKDNYTDNQKITLRNVSQEMLKVPFENNKLGNFEEVLNFMYGGSPNDDVIDADEAEILTDLITEYIPDESKRGEYIDSIMTHPKSDNLDSISKSVYKVNLSENVISVGYELAKAISQVNDADDNEGEKLIPAYKALCQYKNIPNYKTAISKLAAKLMTGKKIDTIASEMNLDREDVRSTLKKML
ncbi:MAG: hypothetical protein ACI4GV_08105 [Acutalibacteraceae bacterium]